MEFNTAFSFVPRYILLYFLPKLRWSSSAKTKEHKNKQWFYLHIFR